MMTTLLLSYVVSWRFTEIMQLKNDSITYLVELPSK